MKKSHIEKIKAAIKASEKKGGIYYPYNDEEIASEWKHTEEMDDKKLFRHIEINSMSHDFY